MQSRSSILVVAVLVTGALAGAGLAQEEPIHRGFGLLGSHVTEDRYDITVGMTVTARPRQPERYTETRTHVAFPSHYGELFQVTQNGNDSILWFRDGNGAIRNALLENSAKTAFVVEGHPSTIHEIKVK